MTKGTAANGSQRARFGPYEVDLHTHELWKFGTKLRLIGQPFEILAQLVRRPGELVTREELRHHLWPSDSFGDFNHGLNAAVNKLRDTLNDSAAEPRYIETLPRRGYRFIAEIEWLTEERPANTAPTPPVAVPRFLDSQTVARRPAPYFVAIGAVLLLLLLGSWVLQSFAKHNDSVRARVLAEQTIKPLTNLLGVFQPSFSPDGNSVVFVRDTRNHAEYGIYAMTIGASQAIPISRNEGDCCPAWSPDGRHIAFSREVQNRNSLQMVDVNQANQASNERAIDMRGAVMSRGEVDWSPDGSAIAFAATTGVAVLELKTSSVRRLTEQPPLSEDWGPKFSSDGERILFVRNRQIGQPDELWEMPAVGGSATRILSEPGRIASVPQWSPAGASVVFASDRNGHPVLFRAPLDGHGAPTEIGETGQWAWNPVFSRKGFRLAYERTLKSLSVWELDVRHAQTEHPHILIPATTDTDQGPGAQFSPDGEKLAYMSDRLGTLEIWVSDRDGRHAFQLTGVGYAGTPRWSPDGESIAFDSDHLGQNKIVTVSLRQGTPHTLIPQSFSGNCPNWSRDGKSVYFASEHTGVYQVWKVPAAGGTPVQLTKQGGHAAWESPDGKTVYYAKNAAAEPEVWEMPSNGGLEKLVPQVSPGTWASWQVVDKGILFVGPALGHHAVLSFFDFANRHVTPIATLDRTPFWLGATHDGNTVVFDQPGDEQAQAMLIENFR